MSEIPERLINTMGSAPSKTQAQIQEEIKLLEMDEQDGSLGPDDEKRLTELRGRLSQPPPPGVVQEFSDAINPLLSEFEKAQSQQSQQPAEPPRTKLSTEYDDAVAEIGGIKKEASNTVPSAAKGRSKEKIQQEIRQLESDDQDSGLGPEDQKRLRNLRAELSQVGSGASQPPVPTKPPRKPENPDPQGGFGGKEFIDPGPIAKEIEKENEAKKTQGEMLSDRLQGQVEMPTLPTGTSIQFAGQEIEPGELLTSPENLQKIEAKYKEASAQDLDVGLPTKPDYQTYTSYAQEGTPEFEAAKGTLSSQSVIGDIQGAISDEAVAQAQTGELDERATIKYQMEALMTAFEEGKPPPAWAAPAIRSAGAIMAQRGLGRSSMAAAAITQAALESGIQIAKEDANKYAAIQLTNLNNRQQAALQNAATFAAMDRANLDARMTAAVNNAKNFLSMDLTNLSNKQKLKEIDLQLLYQKIFKDSAAENAARQFNAKSQAQTDQFFAELEVQVDNSNKNRMASMEQFNADQKNAAIRYYDKLNDSRDKFDSNMEVQIAQSNVSWRRAINTANTDRQNEENRLNALNLLGIQQSAMDKLWQRYRDEASWLVQQSENKAQRAHQVALYAQDNEFKKEIYDDTSKDAFYSQIGGAVYDTFFTVLRGT